MRSTKMKTICNYFKVQLLQYVPSLIVASVALLGIWISGCSPTPSEKQLQLTPTPKALNDVNPAEKDKKVILTTFTVIADIARNVAGDKAIVESIIKPGSEIHGYEPTPSDLVRAKSVDLILDK